MDKNKTQVLWLGTLLEAGQEKEAEGVLNEILDIKSAKIEGLPKTTDRGMSIVNFTIDNKDVPRAAVTRLKTDDIKWATDYPEYARLFDN